MTDPQKNDNDDNTSRESIFQIMDGIIVQLNKTKKMFIIMILTIMIIPPITFALLGPQFPFHDRGRLTDLAPALIMHLASHASFHF
jgi:hypothetical protein